MLNQTQPNFSIGHGQVTPIEPSRTVRNEAKLQPVNSTKTPRAEKQRLNSVGERTLNEELGVRLGVEMNEGQETAFSHLPAAPMRITSTAPAE